MAKDIFDAIYGCLIGGAIGDALGAPVETWPYTEIRATYGKVDELMPFQKSYCGGQPGSITDDTALRQYLCWTIVQKGGRITPDDFGQTWREKVNLDRLWTSEAGPMHKIKWGMSPWDSGTGSLPCGCAAMAIAPIGIINAGNPAQGFQDGFNIAFVNQDGHERDAAASFAAAQAAAFLPQATPESVVEAMAQHSTYVFRRALDRTMDLASRCASVDEFTERFYDRLLDWTWPRPNWSPDPLARANSSGSAVEFVPVVAALLVLCRGDFERCVVEGASFGRDCDTIASLAGNLAGALQGASAIRPDWIGACETANRDFFLELEGDPSADFRSMATRLVEALKREHQVAQGRVALLEQLLG
jgi:ADP-ribosylglycohydrolase